MDRSQQPPEQPTPTPVADDAHATSTQLLARASVDYQHNQAVVQEHQDQGGVGVREGVLPGGVR